VSCRGVTITITRDFAVSLNRRGARSATIEMSRLSNSSTNRNIGQARLIKSDHKTRPSFSESPITIESLSNHARCSECGTMSTERFRQFDEITARNYRESRRRGDEAGNESTGKCKLKRTVLERPIVARYACTRAPSFASYVRRYAMRGSGAFLPRTEIIHARCVRNVRNWPSRA